MNLPDPYIIGKMIVIFTIIAIIGNTLLGDDY
jgi:hypothetical protein